MKPSGDRHHPPHLCRLRSMMTHWLTFFVPEKRPSSQGEAVPIVVLTSEEHQPPNTEYSYAESDCACE